MKSHEWQFFRLRPQNFPTRRIAGLVRFLCQHYKSGLLNGLLKIIYGNAHDLKRLAGELEMTFVIKAEGFWANHYRFEAPAEGQRQDLALIGRNRARDIIVNIVIPAIFLYSEETQEGKLKNIVRELSQSYPKLAENAITRAMRRQLAAGGKFDGKTVRKSLQQQGLIFLHKLYCRPLRCSDCLNLSGAM